MWSSDKYMIREELSWFDAGPVPGTHESLLLTLPCYSWAVERGKNN